MATLIWPQTYPIWPQTYFVWPTDYPIWPEYGASARKISICGPNTDDVIVIDGDGNVDFSCIPTGPSEAPTGDYQFANKKYADDGITTHVAVAAPHSGHVDTTGNETIAGVKTFSSTPVGPSAAPTANYQLANKKYVDDSVPSFALPVGTVLMYDGTGIDTPDTRTEKVGEREGDTVEFGHGDWYVMNGQSDTPDLRNRFVRSENASGNTGGEDTHILTAAQMPIHNHPAYSPTETIIHWIGSGGNTSMPGGTAFGGRASVGNAGGGLAHNNIPAFYSLIFIKRMA